MFRFVFRRVRSSSGSSSSTWRLKKILASLIVIGALGSLTVTGTFALLTSQETNVHSSIASGTLVFDDTVSGGTGPCFSYGGPASPGNVNNTCQALFTSAALNYPGTASTVTLTIKNDGTLPGTLSLYMPTCAASPTPGAPAGGGNPCGAGGALFTIQETNGATTTCWYPSAASACTFTAGDTLQTFFGNYNVTTNALPLTGGLAVAQSRTFTIGVELPSNAANALQGEEAVFGLTWHLST